MSEQFIEDQGPTPDKLFDRMAEKIRHNAGAPFGGAVVVVPPQGYEAIEILSLDASADAAQFWSGLIARIKILLEKADQDARSAQGFGRGR